jgi:hypothetical protein
MNLFLESYSFSEFATRWATELGQEPSHIAALVAAGIIDNGLKYDVLNPNAPGPGHYQQEPFSDDSAWQEFDAAVSFHLHRVRDGIDAPDFVGQVNRAVMN